MTKGETIHAGCVVVGEAGLLIRGLSGSGKTTLARELVLGATQAGRFARLVSDDRTRIAARNGRLLASPVTPLEGLAEIRGLGIVRQRFEPAAVVRLVVDLSEDAPRYPEAGSGNVVLCDVALPRLQFRSGTTSADTILSYLSGVCDTVVSV